jgi:hypothetical protein
MNQLISLAISWEKQEKFRSRQFKVENYYFKQFSNLVFDLFIFIVAKLEIEQN